MTDTPRTFSPDDSEASFLHRAPPHWAAGGLAYVVILLVIAAVIGAAVIHVPETVSSPFLLVPGRGADPVRAARAGRVTEVRVDEGATVAKGQTLFVIRSAAVGDQSAEMAALETHLRGATSARANAREKHESQQRATEEEARRLAERRTHLTERMESHRGVRQSREAKYQTSLRIAESEVASARAEMEFKRQHLALAREIAARYKKGYENHYLSWQDHMRAEMDASKLAVDLEQLERQLEIAVLKIAQLRAEHETEETEWAVTMAQLENEQKEVKGAAEKLRHESQARAAEHRELDRRLLEDTEKATIRTTAVRGALGDARGDRFSVLAPCAGPVLRLAVKRQDAVVHEGEVLCDVACTGERLQAELALPPTVIGKVKSGQGVKLRYEAFPYERYGVRYATVHWVSSAGVDGKDGPAFRALAGLAEETIRIDGQVRPLLAGMGGRAAIVVGRRSLISYAFEPLRQLRENLAGAPGK
jgi:multidrug efflux pump subunit AcrA (membrane-fusion protein)